MRQQGTLFRELDMWDLVQYLWAGAAVQIFGWRAVDRSSIHLFRQRGLRRLAEQFRIEMPHCGPRRSTFPRFPFCDP